MAHAILPRMNPTTRSWLLAALVGILAFPAAGAVPKARPLTEKEVAEKLRFYQDVVTLSAPFQQKKTIKDLAVTLESKGHIEIQPPAKVRWSIEAPAPMTVTVDGLRVSIESGAGSEKKTEKWDLAAVSGEKVSKAFLGMIGWMRLDAAAISKAYTLVELEDGTLQATPKDPTDSTFRSLTFRMHRDGHLQSLRLEEASGDEMVIDFGAPRVQKKSPKK